MKVRSTSRIARIRFKLFTALLKEMGSLERRKRMASLERRCAILEDTWIKQLERTHGLIITGPHSMREDIENIIRKAS